jgi:TolA-binding protein
MLELSSVIAKTAQFSIIKKVEGYRVSKPLLLAGLILGFGFSAHSATPKKLNAFKEGERLIYSKLVESFRRNKLDEVRNQQALLQKNYPQSVHLDNGYYMIGMLEFQDGNLSEAVRNFGLVTDRYPRSNKRPGAMFAKAMAYKQLGAHDVSRKVLSSLIKQYPGSPESQRAWMQLRMAGGKPKAVKR